ncbi:MAG: pilus assembly protein [Rhodobacteraceae bacterium]|nr:MAG: pilus assembly protein [Paracoccaceae bacterium]
MIGFLKNTVSRFAKDESGVITVDFVIVMSAMALILGGSVEMGYMNVRHGMLERGLDMAVRDIRLSTGTVPDYDDLRASICERASIIGNCQENLRLEMKVVDPRDFDPIPAGADCQNAVQVPRPLRSFQSGADNEMMLIRACLMFEPLFPTTGLAAHLPADGDGYIPMVATSAFVQEPR